MGLIIGMIVVVLVLSLLGAVGMFVGKWYQQNFRGPLSAAEIQFNYPTFFTPALIILLLGFHLGLYTFLTYMGPTFQAPAAGGLVFSFAMTIVWLLLQPKKSLFVISLTALNLLLGVSLFFRANGFVQSWSTLLFLGTQVALLVMLISSRAPTSVGEWLTSVFSFIPLTLKQGTRLFRSMFQTDLKSNTTLLSWLKTLIFAFIVLLIFLGLLAQADPVFAEIVREFRTQLFGRVVWTVILIVLAICWGTLPVTKKEETKTEAHWASFRDISVVQTIIVVVTGIFLAVQFQYLFMGSTSMLVELKLTFSEYVRQGFTELLLAVLLGGSIAYLAGTRSRIWQGYEQQLTRVLNSVMLFELGLLLVSAFRRNYVYVETYGLTRVRVIGDFFLLWLALFLVILFVYGWQKVKEKTALAALWTGALLVIVAINIFNVDKMVIAGAPSHHEYTDYFYLLQLSEDGGSEWPQLMASVRQDTNDLLAKTELSDAEQAQLAGLKLATISFIENRDFLYLKYAPETWLLANSKQIGLQFSADNDQNLNVLWYGRPNVIQTLFPSKNAQAQEAPATVKLPDELRKFRSWTFWNFAEANTYKLLATQEAVNFEQPKQILEDILRYQIRHQVNLREHETRLLRELKYQFVTVRLDRYWEQQLTNFDSNLASELPPFVEDEFARYESQNTKTISQLAAATCATVNQETVELYGAATPSQTLPNNQPVSGQLLTVQSIAETQPHLSIMLVIPPEVSVTPIAGTDAVAIGAAVQQLATKAIPTGLVAPISQPQFIKAVVTPTPLVSADVPCSVVYTASQAQLLGWPQ